MTIVEEAHELVERIQNGGVLPMITSCSPGWIKYCETFYPEFLPNVSSCKSPHEMMGAVVKSYYAETNGIDPRDIVVVSVMPCTAKKFEARRPELGRNGMADVDEGVRAYLEPALFYAMNVELRAARGKRFDHSPEIRRYMGIEKY